MTNTVNELCRGWINECLSPLILPYLSSLVLDLTDHIRSQQECIDDSIIGVSTTIPMRIRQLEVDRVQYIIASYLRTRLHKIEKNVFFYALNTESRENLSDEEMSFVDEYGTLLIAHCDESFVDKLPERFREIIVEDDASPDCMPVEAPNADRYVFLRFKETLGPVELNNSLRDTVDISKEDIVLSRYRLLSSFLHDDRAELI